MTQAARAADVARRLGIGAHPVVDQIAEAVALFAPLGWAMCGRWHQEGTVRVLHRAAQGASYSPTYDAERDQYEAECSIWDEGDQFFTEAFDEWRGGLIASGIRPYKNGAGEVDYFRLELTLNELGRAFLVIDRFATDGDRQLTADR